MPESKAWSTEGLNDVQHRVTYLIVDLAGIAVGEGLATAAALQRLVGGVQFLHVDAQIRLAAALGRAQLARVYRLLSNYIQQADFIFVTKTEHG